MTPILARVVQDYGPISRWTCIALVVCVLTGALLCWHDKAP